MITTVAQIFNIECMNFKIPVFFIQRGHLVIYVMFHILLICGKCLQNRIISQVVEVLGHSTSLTPPLFIEMPITSQEIKVSGEIHLYQSVDFASVYTLFRLDLQLFKQYGIYLISKLRNAFDIHRSD